MDYPDKHLCDRRIGGKSAQIEPIADRLSVTCVSDSPSFANLRDEWNALHSACENSSVFMSWEWHHTWWTVFRDKNELSLLCVRRNNELVGILPLYVRQQKWPMPHHVMFTGTGEGEADEVATEYLDVLVREEDQLDEVVSLLVDWLDSHHKRMRFDFRHLLDDSILLSALRRNKPRWVLKESESGFRYRMDIQKVIDNIPMSSKRHKRVKRSLRAIDRDGGLNQSSVKGVSHVYEALNDVSDLSDRRQQHAGRAKSAFSSPRFNLFHHRLLPLLYQAGAADVHHFHLDGELAASLYCFYDERTCHYYQSGFVQSLANRYMPLTVAHLMEIERNRDAGRRYYDFMRGDADSYKNDFNCETTPMVNVVRFPSLPYLWLNETATLFRRRVVRQLKRVGVSRRR